MGLQSCLQVLQVTAALSSDPNIPSEFLMGDGSLSFCLQKALLPPKLCAGNSLGTWLPPKLQSCTQPQPSQLLKPLH